MESGHFFLNRALCGCFERRGPPHPRSDAPGQTEKGEGIEMEYRDAGRDARIFDPVQRGEGAPLVTCSAVGMIRFENAIFGGSVFLRHWNYSVLFLLNIFD